MKHAARWVMIVIVFASAAVFAQSAQRRLDLSLEAERLSFEELARIFPALRGVELPAAVRITEFEAQGPLDNLKVTFAAASPEGAVTGRLVLDLQEPERTARGTIHLRNVELADLLDRPALPEEITADLSIDLELGAEPQNRIRGTFELTTPAAAYAGYAVRSLHATGRIDGNQITIDANAVAYGANVAARGDIVLGDQFRLDLRGRAAGLNLRSLPASLPVPRVPSNLTFTYQLAGSPAGVHGRVELAESVLAGARIGRGTTATFDTSGAGLDYTAKGTVAGLDLQRAGMLLDIEPLQRDRFAGTLNARFEVVADDGTVQSLNVEAFDSTLFGGSFPQLTATLAPAGDALQLNANGRFVNVDPGALLERPALDGSLNGTLDVKGEIPRRNGRLATSAVDLHGALTLGPSTLEGNTIQSAAFTARLTDGARLQIERGELRADGTNVDVSGVFGVDPSIPTSLSYHVNTTQAEAFQDLLGQPIAGGLTLDGTISGQQTLQIDGTLSGIGVAFRGVDAQTVSGDYRAEVPRASPTDASVTATVEMTGLEIAGEPVESALAKLSYEDRRLAFDVDARDADRALGASGSIVWHPDHQEIHLTRLALDIPDARWTLADGSAAAIQYGGDRLVVENVHLVAPPNQSLFIDGTLGDTVSPLRIEARNVELGALEPFIGDQELGGALTLDAVVRGDLAAPEVTASFTGRNGVVRGVTYQTLSGRIDTEGAMYDFDVRLARADSSWVEVEGTIPRALLAADAEARDSAPLDVTVRSSVIDLAIVGGLTERVTNLAGTLQADAVIEGTVGRPRMQGQIVVRNGAFTMPALGTRYTGLDTTILLQPDFVIVEDARVYDDDRDWLSVSGRLAIDELAVGDVALDITAESFEIVDNPFADLEADALLRVTGRLTAPKIVGSIEVIGGRVNVDEVLETTSDRVYGVRAARLEAIADETLIREEESGGLLQGLPVQLDLNVLAPALLLAGTDLQGPTGLAVGLGNVNVTASGDLQLLKSQDGPLRIRGEIQTVRGTYEFQDREFELVRGGTIRFAGGADINPLLSVTATRTISAVEAQVRITGSLERPRLELSSTPPLDDAEILSLIVFNQPAIQLGAGERVSLARRAASLAAGLLASEISGALGDALGLDMFEIEAAGINDGGFSPIITVGEQLGDLYVRFRQQVGAETQSQVVIEYEVNDWLRLQSSIADRVEAVRPLLRRIDGSGIDAVISYEYGGPAETEERADENDAPAADDGQRTIKSGGLTGLFKWLGPRR